MQFPFCTTRRWLCKLPNGHKNSMSGWIEKKAIGFGVQEHCFFLFSRIYISKQLVWLCNNKDCYCYTEVIVNQLHSQTFDSKMEIPCSLLTIQRTEMYFCCLNRNKAVKKTPFFINTFVLKRSQEIWRLKLCKTTF